MSSEFANEKARVRWVGTALGSLVGLTIIAYAVLYVLSERVLQRTYEIPTIALSISTDPASIIEGRRLATILGCVEGCHGKKGEGRVLFDEPMIGRLVAPNLTTAVHKYSDTELAVAVRNGLRPDGRSMVVMPSEAFVELSDADLSRIIAFLRSLPPVVGPGPSLSLGPLGRAGVATGKFKPAAQLIAETVPLPDATDPEAAYGRYLARTTCAHCHGTDLRGIPDFKSPSLQVVAAYSPEAFAILLQTGVGLGGRKLRMMGETARDNLSHLTNAETAALYRYLRALPDAVQK